MTPTIVSYYPPERETGADYDQLAINVRVAEPKPSSDGIHYAAIVVYGEAIPGALALLKFMGIEPKQ